MKVKFNRKIIAIILGLFIITSILIIVGKPIIKNAAEKIEFKISYFNGKIRDLKISKKSLDIEVLVGEKWYKVKTNNYLVKKIEIGDYSADYSKIKKLLKWNPKTRIEDGLKMTIDFYIKNKAHYWK